MNETPVHPRRLGSYESACLELAAQPLEPDPGPPRQKVVQFGEGDWLEEMRRAAAHGLPHPFLLKAFPLPGLPGRPEVIAEFAAELLLARTGRRLTLAAPGQRPPFSERANLRWIIWGDLIVASPGTLAIAPLSIGPWPGAAQQLEPGSRGFNGVTTDVLRAIQPETLIRATIEQLENIADWHQYLAERHNQRIPEEHRCVLTNALDRARRARDGRSYPDDHYRDIALLYLQLLDQGHRRRITTELAQQLNIPTSTARNWIHRARQLDYLTPAQQGQPGAHPGPRLSQPAARASTESESANRQKPTEQPRDG